MRNVFYIILLAVIVAGCAGSRYGTAGKVSVIENTTSRNEIVRDSIFIDRLVRVVTQGDTVYVYRDSITHHYHNSTLHDTITHQETDTIYKYVIPDGYEKPSKADRFFCQSGIASWILFAMLILLGIALLVIKIVRK